MTTNIFIVLDGLDGSGKSEMISKLHDYLSKKNKKFRILTTREPTDGKYGKKIREILKKETNPIKNSKLLTKLYIKDRNEHLKNIIEPFLAEKGNEYNIVLCDRYYYSTLTFQHTQGVEINELIKLNMGFRKPDLCLILDLPPELALKRISKAKRKKEKFEDLEFMKRLRKNFLELKNRLNDNIKMIDASKQKSLVFRQIKKEIEEILSVRL